MNIPNQHFLTMDSNSQRISPLRYRVIPRTLVFLLQEEDILLIKLGEDRGEWSGLYNGVGGHIERGEDPLSAARRELQEETGQSQVTLELCGVAIVNVPEKPGIGLYFFVGETSTNSVQASEEGAPHWIPIDELAQHPLVEDLPLIIPEAISSYRSKRIFSAIYQYDDSDQLSITIYR